MSDDLAEENRYLRSMIWRLYEGVKTLEAADPPNWPGTEVVPLLWAWFQIVGLDPDAPLEDMRARWTVTWNTV